MLDLFKQGPQTPTSGPQGRQQRQSKRFSVPVFDIPIRVDLLVAGVRYPCQLWDVSEHGACLLLRSPVQAKQKALLRIHAPSGDQRIDIEAQLMWLDPVMGTYYGGVQFNQPMDFGPTFLGALMRNAETLSRTPHWVP